MSGTIYGMPIGKWALGTDVQGREAALSGKWIGESLSVAYPNVAVQTPATLETSPLGYVIVGAIVGYLLAKPKKGLLEKIFG